ISVGKERKKNQSPTGEKEILKNISAVPTGTHLTLGADPTDKGGLFSVALRAESPTHLFPSSKSSAFVEQDLGECINAPSLLARRATENSPAIYQISRIRVNWTV